MADRVINVITPSDTYDLVTLDELKTMFGIPVGDTSQDEMFTQYITAYSDMIATYCNRVFAYEEVSETWRGADYDQVVGMKRLFLSHYPLDPTYQIVVETPVGSLLDPLNYVVETKSGKIELLYEMTDPISVTYAGGYKLPSETPPALKQALYFSIRQGQAMMQRLGLSGIRSVSHKESRVMYFDALASKIQPGFGSTSGPDAAANLLMHYVRLEV